MSRPRKISDEDVVEAVATMVSREGPTGLTFASASAVTGLSPATLVQRYGNREALLRAALLWMWDQLDLTTAGADAAHTVDPEGAIAMLVRMSAGYGGGDEAGQGLLLLREDFRDPVLRAPAERRSRPATGARPADGEPVAGRGAVVGLFAGGDAAQLPQARTARVAELGEAVGQNRLG
jgi:AcrR family transcriptional regulator